MEGGVYSLFFLRFDMKRGISYQPFLEPLEERTGPFERIALLEAPDEPAEPPGHLRMPKPNRRSKNLGILNAEARKYAKIYDITRKYKKLYTRGRGNKKTW